jgi:hypothetical protein
MGRSICTSLRRIIQVLRRLCVAGVLTYYLYRTQGIKVATGGCNVGCRARTTCTSSCTASGKSGSAEGLPWTDLSFLHFESRVAELLAIDGSYSLYIAVDFSVVSSARLHCPVVIRYFKVKVFNSICIRVGTLCNSGVYRGFLNKSVNEKVIAKTVVDVRCRIITLDIRAWLGSSSSCCYLLVAVVVVVVAIVVLAAVVQHTRRATSWY